MPSPVPAGPQPTQQPQPQLNPLKGFLKMIDWRLVAAIGLPLWAFLLGVVVSRKPTPPAPPIAEATETATVAPTTPEPPPQPPPPTPPAPPVPAPAPPEVVIRTELQQVPVVIPVPVTVASEPVVVAVPAPAVEFKLPASEIMPADRCKTYDTKLRFHPDLATAAEEAKTSKKMLLVLHISGNFDDPGFT